MASTFSIVGVLNTTPDSYFDGGKYHDVDDAVWRAGEMLQRGADIIEIGGESTGPGSKDVSSEEEVSRVIPVLQAIKDTYPDAVLSVDTYKSTVAQEAIKIGVAMINDITAGRGDSQMFSVISSADVLYAMMYAKDETARTTTEEFEYDNVIETVSAFLLQRKEAAIEAGIDESQIIVDPGLGHFVSGKPEYSFQILSQLQKLTSLGSPIFVSPSRKSFLAGPENLPPKDRLPGTIAASVIAVKNGATYIRTHDVLSVRRACDIAQNL